MSEEKIYSVYLFTFPNNKKYCGQTSQKVEKRWNHGEGYKKCPLVYRAILKYGWDNVKKEIIYTTHQQAEAYAKEKEIIKSLNLLDPEYGYNLDPGGRPQGASVHFTEETRKKLSEAHKKTWENPEFREKMKEIHKKTYYHMTTEEQERGRQKSIETRRGKVAHNAKAVLQYDKDSNVLIDEYSSASAASLAVLNDVMGCSNILNVCKGKRKTAYGFIWRFKE